MTARPPYRPRRREIDPTAGMMITMPVSWLYLTGRLHFLPRSTADDIAFAAALALCWGTAFCWDRLARRFPWLSRVAAHADLASGIVCVTAYYLIFTG